MAYTNPVTADKAQQDFQWIRGDTLSSGDPTASAGIPIRFESGGAPKDLTGFSAKMQVRKTKETRNAILTFSSTDGSIDMTDAASGRIILKKTAAEMDIKLFDNYYYDLQLTDPSGNVWTPMYGYVSVVADITRT